MGNFFLKFLVCVLIIFKLINFGLSMYWLYCNLRIFGICAYVHWGGDQKWLDMGAWIGGLLSHFAMYGYWGNLVDGIW